MPKSYVLVTMEIEDSESPDTLRFGTGREALQRLENLIKRAKSAQPRIRVACCPLDDSGNNPEGSILCDASGGAPAAGETVTFTLFDADVVLTVGEEIPETDDSAALNNTLAEVINLHPQLGTVLSALSDGSTVTLIGRFPGALLEGIAITTTDATTFTCASIGADSSGTDSEAAYFPSGKQNA